MWIRFWVINNSINKCLKIFINEINKLLLVNYIKIKVWIQCIKCSAIKIFININKVIIY